MTIRSNGIFRKQMPGYHNARSADYVYGLNEVGIDTGVIIEGEGVLFLGKTTIQEMAEVMGWTWSEDWVDQEKQYQQDIAWLQGENERLKKENHELTTDLAAFGRALAKQSGVKASD